MSADEPTFLDGNAAAGVLHEVFAADLTAAVGQCAGCGRRAALADTRLYTRAPGLVVRCRDCDGVLLRAVAAPGRMWLDMRGLVRLEVPTEQVTSPP
ncbi:MAG: hypothetical protein GEV03_06400 [Streptosporangiales bacterium]|jgi:Family of unknown function (DUF6510)|nr:hypothetical protein [Streptosporangiales bacterium]